MRGMKASGCYCYILLTQLASSNYPPRCTKGLAITQPTVSQTFSLHNSVVPAESGMLEKGGQVPPIFCQTRRRRREAVARRIATCPPVLGSYLTPLLWANMHLNIALECKVYH